MYFAPHFHPGTKQPSPFSCFDALQPLKCPSCSFSTESLIVLRYHLVQDHNQQKFSLKAKLKTCKKCRFHTHSNYLWIRHQTFGTCKNKKGPEVKRDGKFYLCEKCDFRTVYKNRLQTHIIYKHTPLHEIDWQHCKECPAKFKYINGLKQHMKRVHVFTAQKSGVELLYCTGCDFSTFSKGNLMRHISSKHTLPEEIKWFQCDECGFKFKDKTSLKYHLKVHSIKEKEYKCDQCSFETHHKDSLKTHITLKHLKDEEITWYNCQHCDYKAKRTNSLSKHIEKVHLKSMEWVHCPHCSFKTKYNSSVKSHIAKFHDDATFKCDLCNYSTKYKKMIECHKKKKHCDVRKHLDVKRFKCEHCDFSSKYNSNLKSHVFMKHNTDGEIFQCKECDYKTRSKIYLNKHMKRMGHKLSGEQT